MATIFAILQASGKIPFSKENLTNTQRQLAITKGAVLRKKGGILSWPTALFTLREQMSSTISLTVGGSRKKDEAVRFFKKILKGLLDCNEMLLANFLPIVQKKLLNSSHLSVTLQLPHISLIWELVVGTLDVFPMQEVIFVKFPMSFSRHLGGFAI